MKSKPVPNPAAYKKRGLFEKKFWDNNIILLQNILDYNKNVSDKSKKLDIKLRGGVIHVYYKGGKILDIRFKCAKFDNKYLKNFPQKEEIQKKWLKNIDSDKENNQTLNRDAIIRDTKGYLECMSNVMDFWFKENPKDEREHQHYISLAPHDSIKVIDIEFAVSFNSLCYNQDYIDNYKKKTCPSHLYYEKYPNPRFDIIGISPEGQIYVFELKTGLDSIDNMEKHVLDFASLIGSEERFRYFNEEMKIIIDTYNSHKELQSGNIPSININLRPKFYFLFTDKSKPKGGADQSDFRQFQMEVNNCFDRLAGSEDKELVNPLIESGIINKEALYSHDFIIRL